MLSLKEVSIICRFLAVYHKISLNKHDNFTINDNIRHVKENRIAVYICTAVPDVKASYNTKKKKRTQTEGNSLNGLLDYFRTRWTHRKKYQ